MAVSKQGRIIFYVSVNVNLPPAKPLQEGLDLFQRCLKHVLLHGKVRRDLLHHSTRVTTTASLSRSDSLSLFHKNMSGSRNLLPKSMPISFAGVHLALEVFQEIECKEMLALPYLILQACISFLRCLRLEWCMSVFALFV